MLGEQLRANPLLPLLLQQPASEPQASVPTEEVRQDGEEDEEIEEEIEEDEEVG